MKHIARLAIFAMVIDANDQTHGASIYTNETNFLAAIDGSKYFFNPLNNLAWGAYYQFLTYSGAGFAYNISATGGIYGLDGAASTFAPGTDLSITLTSGNIGIIGGNFYLTDAFGYAADGLVQVILSDGTQTTSLTTESDLLPFVGFSQNQNITSVVIHSLDTNLWVALDDVYAASPANGALSILTQPANQSSFLGATVGLSVLVGGALPRSFQWRFGDTNITGATNSQLLIHNAQATNAGIYSVLVTNAQGLATSSNAYLSFVSIAAWGDSQYGETSVPADLTNVLAIAAGGYDCIGLKGDNTVSVWGQNQLSPPGISNIVAVSAGSSHYLALRSGGTVVAWGNNSYGQTNVPAHLTNVLSISAGSDHNLALKADSTVVAWGYNYYNQINVPAGLSNVVAIAAGSRHSMALKADGKMVAWGANFAGLPVSLTNVVAIAAGDFHNVALKSDGSVAAWGSNFYGQTNVPAGLTNVIGIAAGGSHSLALKSDGSVVVWGENIYNQTNVPIGLTNVIAISTCGNFSLALIGAFPFSSSNLFTKPFWSFNQFSVSIPTTISKVYALEFKNNLLDGQWTALPLVTGTGGLQGFKDTTATNVQRYYRVRWW